MLAEKALNTEIQPLTGRNSISEALKRMDKFGVNSLPIVDTTTEKLIGQLRYSQLRKANDLSTPISSLELEEPIKIFQRQHIFEGARLMLQYELRLLPVIDDAMTFKGVIRKQQVLESLTHMLNLATYGSILTVALEKRDFMLSEIVNIIETEGAKILGLTVETPSKEEGGFRVSIKINLKDATRVVSALNRYDYEVTWDETDQEMFGFDMESRASELIKYLDM
ncbi:MAG: CBS domain-containing protein [Balneolaceae bacterium]|nr:CBS domain-containing protein [Balneolaceae bacterium]